MLNSFRLGKQALRLFAHWCMSDGGLVDPFLTARIHKQTNTYTYIYTLKQTHRVSTNLARQARMSKFIQTHSHKTLGRIALLRRVIYYTKLNTHWHFMLLAIPLTWLVIIDSLWSLPPSLPLLWGHHFNATAKLHPFFPLCPLWPPRSWMNSLVSTTSISQP